MNDEIEKKLIKIKKFLRHQMSPEESAEFRNSLSQDPELKKLSEDVYLIDRGLTIEPKLTASHIDSEDLALYAENENILGGDKRRDLENHLKDCRECREELQTCRRALSSIQKHSPKQASLLRKFLDLFRITWISRPALNYAWGGLAVIALALLSVPVYHIADNYFTEKQTLVCRLTPVTRGAGNSNIYVMNSQTDSLRIELNFPTPDDLNLKYDLRIYSASEKIIFEKQNFDREFPVAIVLPIEYFEPGLYRVFVIERLENIMRREIVFPLDLRNDN